MTGKIDLTDYSRFENKLRRIIQLNLSGVLVYTERTSDAKNMNCSRSEFIEAFKKDIDKTAEDLCKAVGIINSINNGLIQEICTLDNTVENFFGNTYDHQSKKITLSGVVFDIDKNNSFDKSAIVEIIYSNLFNLDRKELALVVKALAKYEDREIDEVSKAILYPSTIKADEIISKINTYDILFREFRDKMSFNERVLFDATFERSGVTDVIQNSTFIDIRGVRQYFKKHNINDVNNLAEVFPKLKYIESVEIDGDASVSKAIRMIELTERLKINCEHKFTLKFRKLKNLNVRGCYFHAGSIVAEDYRNTSALLHEIAHFIHMSNLMDNEFVNYMIDKLTPRINFKNLLISDAEKSSFLNKYDYYTNSKEVVARALEVAALFAVESSKLIVSSDDFDFIKSRIFYETLEGIYFDFNSFDDQTIEEMNKLYKLFFETSPHEVQNTGIDNFYKIDTRYLRTKKDNKLTIDELIRLERKKQLKDKKVLYSMVNTENIETIIANRGLLDIQRLSNAIFINIELTGGHNLSMPSRQWAVVCEDRANVIMACLNEIKKTHSLIEYIEYMIELRRSVLSNIDNYVLLAGFKKPSVRKEIREFHKTYIQENGIEQSSFIQLNELRSKISNSALLLDETGEVVNNIQYMENLLDSNNLLIQRLDEHPMIEHRNFIRYCEFIFSKTQQSSLFPKSAFADKELARKILEKDESSYYRISDELKKDVEFNTWYFDKFEDMEKLKDRFIFVDSSLKSNIEFMKRYILKDNSLISLANEDIRNMIIDDTKEIEVIPTETIIKKTTKKATKKIKEVNSDIDFEEIISSNTIVDSIDEYGNPIKVLEIKNDLPREIFKSFCIYMNKNKIGSYKRGKGFVLKNMEMVASVTTTIYAAELLETFANGVLF